jgi:molecular chaperone GrpE
MTAGETEKHPDEDGGVAQNSVDQGAEGDLTKLAQERDESRENFLRLAAELDNVRKRNAREVENARKYGVERFAHALLPVFDSLEASLTIEHADIESFLEGQRAIMRLLDEAFQSVGVSQIDPHGHPFDPTRHEAISMLPSAHAEPHSVVDVVQKGYTIQDRVLRPARVVVAQPPAEDDEDASSSD